jgi:hypothetical protein
MRLASAVNGSLAAAKRWSAGRARPGARELGLAATQILQSPPRRRTSRASDTQSCRRSRRTTAGDRATQRNGFERRELLLGSPQEMVDRGNPRRAHDRRRSELDSFAASSRGGRSVDDAFDDDWTGRCQGTECRSPSFLPDGRHFLCLALTSLPETSGIHVATLDGGPPRRLLAAEAQAVYVQPRGDQASVVGQTRSGTTNGLR